MTVWDYLDKHEIIGTALVGGLAFCAVVAIDNVAVNVCRALQTKWSRGKALATEETEASTREEP